MIVDPRGRRFVGRQANGQEISGALPPEINPANTAFTYAGSRWTMLLWPFPADALARRQLVAHELWHRVQDSLGFRSSNPDNGHLDREVGRVWLRLETRALARALATSGVEAAAALRDALSFRAARYRALVAADSNEALLERNEGLAEYTGIRLSGRPAPAQRAVVLTELWALESKETIARSFAYATGPAYGLLLDRFRPGWRRELRDGMSFAALAGRAVGPPEPGVASELKYDGIAIRGEESGRASRRDARRRDLVARFVAGPILVLPLREANVGFDPGRAESLDSLGTVYGGLRLTDQWGVLEAAESGGLVGPTWKFAAVPVDSSFSPTNPAGAGWRLTLKAGWIVVADALPRRWRLVPGGER